MQWSRIGRVAVDSGNILILDPGRLNRLVSPPSKDIDAWYDRFVVRRKRKSRELGIAVTTTWGRHKLVIGQILTGVDDGMYEVEARLDKLGRIAEVRIRFTSASE
jgi:hypothetical protein